VHAGVPLAELQAIPQPPQCATEVVRFDSQPFESLPSQSPQPMSHATTEHVPAAQEPVAWAGAHGMPQVPQFCSVLRSVSQPFAGLPSQLAKNAAQLGTHAPAMQLVVPLSLTHVLVQLPQVLGTLSGDSQPLAAAPSQLPQPVLHEIWHCPAAQLGAPLIALHAPPHTPQCCALVARSVSQPFSAMLSQLPLPAAHTVEHWPAAHNGVPPTDEHTVVHVPQRVGSVSRFVSHPFCPLPSQSPNPGLHAIEQAPLLQVGVPVLPSHCLPHTPQLFASLISGTSQPFAASPSQLPHPGLHTITHWPNEHIAEPFEALQPLPHVPQWLMSVEALTSQPLVGMPSQSLNPATHANTSQMPAEHFQSATFSAPGFLTAHSTLMLAPSSATPLQSSSLPLQLSTTDPGCTSAAHFNTPDSHCVLPVLQIPGSPVLHDSPLSVAGSSIVMLQSLSLPSHFSGSGNDTCAHAFWPPMHVV
jgi:hypothetical protein